VANPKKQRLKPKYMRHPITDQKLLVLDSFQPKSLLCPVCTERNVEQVTTVDSEYRGGVRYQVLVCEKCENPNWVVLIDSVLIYED